jgi:outer membrane protein
MLQQDFAFNQEREQQGEATVTDVEQTTTRLEAARSSLAEAQSALAGSEADFLQQIGHAPGKLTMPVVPEAILPRSLEEARLEVLRINPEIKVALHRERAARQAIAKASADFYPQAYLDAGYDRTSGTPQTVDNGDDAQITLRVALPITLGGETMARSRQARFLWQQRLQETIAKRLEMRSLIDLLWANLLAIRQQIGYNHAGAQSSQRALKGVREQRKVGDKTALDELDTERDYVESRLRELRSRFGLVEAAYSVLATIGNVPE